MGLHAQCMGGITMIEIVEQWLKKKGLAKHQDTIEFSARLCGNWSLLCYVNKVLKYFVKIENFNAIETEYRALENWHQRLPEHILAPIYLGQLEGKRYYIQKAIPHEMLSFKLWFKEFQLRESASKFFKSFSRFQLNTQSQQDITSSFKLARPTNYHQQVMHIVKHDILQHGDFVLNNIGVHGQRLLIFDWEDYGKSKFALLDISTFVMSLCDFEIDQLLKAIENPNFAAWLADVLKGFSVTLDQFLYCLPYALMVFCDLKMRLGYSKDVIQRTKNAIELSSKLLRTVDA